MNKGVILAVLATLVILAGGVFLFSRNSPPQTSNVKLPTSYEYFWGDDCPHCANVAKFLETWDRRDQVKIEKFEVWSSTKNASLMEARYNYCQIPRAEMGVPLLFTPDGKCYSGDTPIIDYLKNLE